jgi:phosphate transport system substrate-binding protein
MLSKFCEKFRVIWLWLPLITIFPLSPAAFAEESLKIGGTGCALGSIELVAKAFEKSNPGAKVEIISQSLGSSGAIKAVSKGAIGIGLSARMITDEEKKMGLSVIEYAKTPLILATRREVNISGLSTGELAKIFRGETATWPGGERIRLVLRLPTETDILLVRKLSSETAKAVDTALSRQGMVIAQTDQECADLIEKTPGGLGISTLTQTLSERRPFKILSLNGLTPSVNALKDGSYPLFKSLYFTTKTEPPVWVRKFIDFIGSSAGRKILDESGNWVVIGRIGG